MEVRSQARRAQDISKVTDILKVQREKKKKKRFIDSLYSLYSGLLSKYKENVKPAVEMKWGACLCVTWIVWAYFLEQLLEGRR